MTTPKATERDIERRAQQLFEQDKRDNSYPVEWHLLEDHLREMYRASARYDLGLTNRRGEVAR